MVSQGAQTNGILVNGRKLMKSYSEAGGCFVNTPPHTQTTFGPEPIIIDHEPLQRTQSEEPPRSPFLPTSPPPTPAPQSDSSSLAQESDESSKYQREIFIDFEPQMPLSPMKKHKKVLLKTVSDGEMLLDIRKTDLHLPDKTITSFSHDNIALSDSNGEMRTFTPYFQNSPIRHENIFRDLDEPAFPSFASGIRPQDSLDEEFHENLIYRGMFRKRSASSSDQDQLESEPVQRKSSGPSPEDDSIVPSSYLLPDQKISPFASTDSLVNDLTRDHSDGIWNESQATVLQADSGTDTGTGLSTSDVTTSLSPATGPILLTPSSRRKHLLMMQHLQRSSMDTEALEEEDLEDHQMQIVQSPSSPRVIIEPPSQKSLHPDSGKQMMTRPRLTLSPARRRRTPEPSAPSPQPAVVPDLLLARTDSGKTNTDVSESTTTDDYITANSGTDSSKKSGSNKVKLQKDTEVDPILLGFAATNQ